MIDALTDNHLSILNCNILMYYYNFNTHKIILLKLYYLLNLKFLIHSIRNFELH